MLSEQHYQTQEPWRRRHFPHAFLLQQLKFSALHWDQHSNSLAAPSWKLDRCHWSSPRSPAAIHLPSTLSPSSTTQSSPSLCSNIHVLPIYLKINHCKIQPSICVAPLGLLEAVVSSAWATSSPDGAQLWQAHRGFPVGSPWVQGNTSNQFCSDMVLF